MLFLVAVNEAFGVHWAGVFREKLVYDKIFAVATFEVDFGFSLIFDVSLDNSARSIKDCSLGFRKTGKGDDFA